MNHLTDEQLQNYLDKNATNSKINDHLENCEQCRQNLHAYQKLYGILNNENIPDLSDAVIESTLNKLDNSIEKKWSIVENTLISAMFLISIVISFELMNFFNLLKDFSSIDFTFFTAFIKSISPLLKYIAVAFSIFIIVELLDRFKIQKT
jgi:hypothetical protein